MAVSTYTKSGNKATTPAKLDKSIFGLEINSHDLLKQAYISYLARSRQNLALTKTRGLVRGGGRKPWKQKGTGRARFGSSRTPIWRGGGITFGPTGEENYLKTLNARSRQKAIKQALSLAAKDNKIIVIEDIVLKNAKTKELNQLLIKLGNLKRTLLIVDTVAEDLRRAARNLVDLKITSAKYINVYDTLNADHLIFTSAALKEATSWLNKEKKHE